MPNGIDKNWYRMCAAINGFRVRYGRWPTKIRLPEGAIEYLFAEETFARLEEKLIFVYDGSTFIAEDPMGRNYNLGKDGFSEQLPDIHARDWLGVKPDSRIVKEYYAPHRSAKDSKKADHRRIGYSSALLSDIVLSIMVIVFLVIAAKESGAMGFIMFAITGVAFSVAAVISIIVGIIGIVLYIWRGRHSQRTRRAFWYILIGGIGIGLLIINVVPFPQAPAGSNYSELTNEWVIKAVVYALIPGVACLLGGIASIFSRTTATRTEKNG